MLKHILAAMAAVLAVLTTASLAYACPNVTVGAQTMNHSATQLYSPIAYNVTAGGDVNLANCGAVPGVGWVVRNPDFSLYYEKNANYALEFRTEANCDTILLINTGAGNYYYDDDDGGGSNALIRLSRPSAGRYDIWVGTYDPSNCAARLILETF